MTYAAVFWVVFSIACALAVVATVVTLRHERSTRAVAVACAVWLLICIVTLFAAGRHDHLARPIVDRDYEPTTGTTDTTMTSIDTAMTDTMATN